MEKLNTLIGASAASSWFSDLDMEEYNFFPEECHMNLLDVDNDEDNFLSHDIASALQGNILHHKQSLSSECTSKTQRNSSTNETSTFERPSKLLKTTSTAITTTTAATTTSSNSPTITENVSPKLSSSSPCVSPFHHQCQILSFDNINSSPTTQFYGLDYTLSPKQHESQKGSSTAQNLGTNKTLSSHGKRSLANAQDHIIAERKRREKISQSFIALAALVPGLKKMDKASVLGDAIKYVKELKERVVLLEQESKKTNKEEPNNNVVLNKAEHSSGEDDSSSCDESIDNSESVLQVDARVSGQEVLLRIQCHNRKGILVKILSEIQTLNLFLLNSSVLPFGDSSLDMTIIAQMGEGYNLAIKELIKNLRVATLKFLS